MGLLRPSFHFTRTSHNLPSTLSTTAGNALTANANDVDSAVTTILTALAHDVHYLVLNVGGFFLSTADGKVAMDVLINTAGGAPDTLLIADLAVGCSTTQAAGRSITSRTYHFPLFIPSGSTVGVRQRARHTANLTTGRLIMYAHGDPSYPQAWWCGRGVETLGITGTTGNASYGAAITPGGSGAWGSWTTIGTSTSDYGAVQVGINGSDSGMANNLAQFEFGHGSTRAPGIPPIHVAPASSERFVSIALNLWPGFCSVRSGTTWQARGMQQSTAEAYYCTVYGVF